MYNYFVVCESCTTILLSAKNMAPHLNSVDAFSLSEEALGQILRRERRRVQADFSVHRTRHDHLSPVSGIEHRGGPVNGSAKQKGLTNIPEQ